MKSKLILAVVALLMTVSLAMGQEKSSRQSSPKPAAKKSSSTVPNVSGNNLTMSGSGTVTNISGTASFSSIYSMYKSCDSIRFANSGDWKPAITAPHDGTTVEMMETYGIAPWYGIFKWDGHWWAQVDVADRVVGEDNCLFWRPYRKTQKSYIDPAAGKQNSVSYWCAAMHRAYDKKTDSCK